MGWDPPGVQMLVVQEVAETPNEVSLVSGRGGDEQLEGNEKTEESFGEQGSD